MSYVSNADIGGQLGHGAVVPEPEGELFHADWEPAALAMNLAMGATGSWNLDTSRAARETLPDYARLSYYQIWVAGLEKMMLERGQIFEDELAQGGKMLHPPAPVARVLRPAEVAPALAKGSSTRRPDVQPPKFQIGQRVRTRAHAVPHHTRLPGYVRGKTGVVESLHGCHVFADTHAQGLGENPEPLYTVVFEGAEIWGADAAPGLRISVDAWQSYLEAA
jgi:nitrile hydratase beta subunit